MKNNLGIGTWKLNNYLCQKIVENALEIGYKFIDTGSIYKNEKYIGRAINKININRSKYKIISKINFKKYSIEESVKRSLDDLNTNYIDILLIHWPIFKKNLNEDIKNLIRIKKQNLAKEIGISNFNSYLIRSIKKNLVKELKYNQIEFHPFINQKKILKMNKLYKLETIAYCPFARGKINNHSIIKKIAKQHGKNCNQIILKWISTKNIIPIPGTSNLDHLKANFNIQDINLSNKNLKDISNLYKLNYRLVENLSKYKWY